MPGVTFYDYSDDMALECPACDWSGRAGECSKEIYSELFDLSCPGCDKIVLIVPHPSYGETLDAAEAGNQSAIDALPGFERQLEFIDRAGASELRDPDQLPDIDAETFELIWDFEWRNRDEDSLTVIRHGDREIWREVAYYEGGDRFADVFDILKQRYGERLTRLEPTERSWGYLAGDHITPACRRALAGLASPRQPRATPEEPDRAPDGRLRSLTHRRPRWFLRGR